MSFISQIDDIAEPAIGHAWRAGDGTVFAVVNLDGHRVGITFNSAADARRLAAVCTEAAGRMDALAAESAPAKEAGNG